jgi:polyhydroxyalkanoate synthase
MTDRPSPQVKLPDPQQLAETMQRVAQKGQQVMQAFLDRQQQGGHEFRVLDPQVMMNAYQEWAQHLAKDPGKALALQLELWQKSLALWQQTAQRLAGQEAAPVAAPRPGDKRFNADEWQENPVFDFIKQSYLLTAGYLQDSVTAVDGVDQHTRAKVEFYTRQFIDALAPTNFVATNPQVLKQTLESGGENLVKGLENMLADLESGGGNKLRIRMTDLDKFRLGENVATTPGKVVFQNDLMQLLQYTPTSAKVYRRPLLIIPPWINKFYILDLRAKNSFIKWAVDQGHTVFVISWVNPDATLAEKSFDDYLREGPLAALDAIEQATGEHEVKAIGYCLGGTLLATTLAWLAAAGDPRIKAATFFTTMVDFAEPGELGVFIDDEQIGMIEREMDEKGYFEGATMAEAFNLLRANDLVWSFVVNNYLMGREPFPFDLLFWNSDSTRMPRAMHKFYLRNMYQRNLLREPGGLTLAGRPLDLRAIATPCYVLAAKDDHIAPWTSAYAATQLYAGSVRFVLGASGHIAGVINPPAANKYGYWTGAELPPDPAAWLAGATRHEGSWWSDWKKWVAKYNGKKVPARQPGDGALEVLEEAPGSYVKLRI